MPEEKREREKKGNSASIYNKPLGENLIKNHDKKYKVRRRRFLPVKRIYEVPILSRIDKINLSTDRNDRCQLIFKTLAITPTYYCSSSN